MQNIAQKHTIQEIMDMVFVGDQVAKSQAATVMTGQGVTDFQDTDPHHSG